MATLQSIIKKMRKGAKTLFKSGRFLGSSGQGIEVTMGANVDWANRRTQYVDSFVSGSSGGWTHETGSATLTTRNSTVEYKVKVEKPIRIEKKPVEIWGEIVSEIPKIDLVDIDKKIKVVKRRKDFLEDEMQISARDEKMALGFLEARKKFPKYGHMFKWSVTNMDAIDALCNKYKVQYVNFSGYYKTVPNEALDELEAFMTAWKKVRKDEPLIKLITDEGGPEQVKDPILLAASPFGKWFYILGAWDKEIEFVDELVYGNK